MTEQALYIPVSESTSAVRVDLDALSTYDFEDVLNVLAMEVPRLEVWLRCAVEYFRQGRLSEFRTLLESVQKAMQANFYDESPVHDKVAVFNGIASSLIQEAVCNPETRDVKIKEAIQYLTAAQQIHPQEIQTFISRGLLYMLQGHADRASVYFDPVLTDNPNSIPGLLGKAALLVSSHKYREALGLYQQVLRVNPAVQASVRLGIGICAYHLGDLSLAYEAFHRTYTLDSSDTNALIGLSIVELQRSHAGGSDAIRHIETALKWAEHAYAIDPSSPTACAILADHYVYQGFVDEAAAIAKEAYAMLEPHIKTDGSPETLASAAEVCYVVGKCHHVRGEMEHAGTWYALAHRHDPQSSRFRFALAQTLFWRGESVRAVTMLEQVREASPENFYVRKLLGFLYVAQQDVARAKVALTKAMQLNPADADVKALYAELHESVLVDGASKALDVYADMTSEMTPYQVLNNKGALYLRQRQYDLALPCFEQAIAVFHETEDGVHPTLVYNAGLVYEAKGDWKGALERYMQLLEMEDADVQYEARLRVGAIAERKGETEEAVREYEALIEFEPSKVEARAALGNLYLRQHQFNESKAVFNAILALDLADEYAKISLANIDLAIHQQIRKSTKIEKRAHGRKCLKRAEEAYRSLLRVNGHNEYAANGLGAVFAAQGQYGLAEEVFGAVREADTSILPVLTNLAHTSIKQKKYNTAIKLYENGLKMQFKVQDTEMVTYLARAHFLAGDFEAARKTLEDALAQFPGDAVLRFNLAFCTEEQCLGTIEAALSQPAESAALALCYEQLVATTATFTELQSDENEHVSREAAKHVKECERVLTKAKKLLEKSQSRSAKELAHEEEYRKRMQDLRLSEEHRLEEERLQREKKQQEEEKRAAAYAQRAKESLQQDWLNRKNKKRKERAKTDADTADVSEPEPVSEEESAPSSSDEEALVVERPTKQRKKSGLEDEEE